LQWSSGAGKGVFYATADGKSLDLPVLDGALGHPAGYWRDKTEQLPKAGRQTEGFVAAAPDTLKIRSTYRAIKSISRLTFEPAFKCRKVVTSTVCGIRLIENSQPSGRSFTLFTVRLTPFTVTEPL
jgi:hypothetical protein